MSALVDADEGEFEEVSDEEKLKIAQHFLLSSPPGQFSDVLQGEARSLCI